MAAFAYSIVLLACFAWHSRDQQNYTLELARSHARTAWAKDVDYRRWSATHGGVYVPITEKTLPNAHLTAIDREIKTPSGRALTLVNPAYMTRQVHELAQQRAGVIGHITSLKPIRPQNAADAWEAEALQAFERGQTEVSGCVQIDGEPYMRLMRPLVTEQSCLKCHAAQGYQTGDIRGGIGAAIPMAPLLALAKEQARKLVIGYAMVWLLGLIGIGAAALVIRRQIQERDHAQRQLVMARDMAQYAARAKGTFLANMSHEIRTPMTAILGFADNLLDPDVAETERTDAVHTIRRNGQHLLQVINDILDLSKIEAGRLDVEHVECQTRRMLYDVAHLLKAKAEEKGLVLCIESDGLIPDAITSDSTRLKQALVNLVGNAIKFTERGSVRIIASCDRANEIISFAVVDTGIGITPEQASRIFEPFVQADTSTTRHYGGTGLGLIITRRIAELLGGTVTACSRIGEGSTFTLSVATGPLEGVQMVGAAEPRPTTLEAPIPVEALPRIHGRILLAEDGPDNQRLISFILRKAGAEVIVVANGCEAVEAALAALEEGTPYPVILMDIQMPVMDGYEAVRILRQKGYTGQIIALTAHAMKGELDKCLTTGCDHYLSKPIARDTLIREVAARMGQASAPIVDQLHPTQTC